MSSEKNPTAASPDPGSPHHDKEAGPVPEQDLSLPEKKVSAFKSLGWLDRYLAVWIFLSMAVGIILGNFVPNISQALEKGKLVDVSLPIGKYFLFFSSSQL